MIISNNFKKKLCCESGASFVNLSQFPSMELFMLALIQLT